MEAALTKNPFWKRKWFIYSVIVFFGVGFVMSLVNDKTPTTTVPVTVSEATDTPSQSDSTNKAEAQKELDDLMTLAKKGGLIKSYEFTDSATVVYADSAWYSQTVEFKKDFLAKVGTLKKQITGFQHFEVRDAYSNEKVAEITSFGGSLKVYK